MSRGAMTRVRPPMTPGAVARPALDDLARRFGGISHSCVYFVQRRPGEPIKIGTSTSLQSRVVSFLNGSPDPVLIRATVAGGQALESWFHRRHHDRHQFAEWFDDAEAIVEDALAFAAAQHAAFDEAEGDRDVRLRIATLDALRQHDPLYRDAEQLRRNGVPTGEIGKMAGLDGEGGRVMVEQMRALGFDMGYRRVFASRSARREAPVRGARMLG